MDIAKNKTEIMKKVAVACSKTDRDVSEIQLLAVTKTRSIEEIENALKHGISLIGENKVQEAEAKIPLIKGKYEQFHFIGHLQSNKAKKLLKLKPDMIHSIDKLSTLRKLNELAGKEAALVNVLIQVNTSGEESKFGIEPQEAKTFIRSAAEFENIKIQGLMTIGLFTDDEKLIRNCFRILKLLFADLKSLEQANCEMKYLSMGMSNDYEIAVEEGANILRIGTALFGPRNY